MRAPFALLSLAAALSASLLASPLAAQSGGMAAHQGAMDETNNPADAAFIAAMRGMMIGMHRAMPTGDTDRDFVRMMLPHHQSAVDMAKAEVQYGQDPELKKMAQTVIDDQGREIALMKAWEDKHPK